MASSRANRAIRPAPHGTRDGLPLTGEPASWISSECLSLMDTRGNMWALDCLAATSSQLEQSCANLSDLVRSQVWKRGLGQVRPSKDGWGRVRPKLGWPKLGRQDRRCWPTTRCLTRPRLDGEAEEAR